MPRDPQAEGALLVLTIKAALAPHLERVAALETENKEFRARLQEMSGFRDRVIDRLIAMEVKAAVPVMTTESVVDIGPVLSRLSALEAKEPTPGPPGKDGAPGAIGEPGRPGERGPEGQPGPSGRDGRDGLPGVQGEKGLNGKDGLDGKDGAPGLNGKDGVPGLSFQKDYQPGDQVEAGKVIFFAGCSWHCNETTTTKPDIGAKEWALLVKRGRDGKDGRDLAPPLPIVKVS